MIRFVMAQKKRESQSLLIFILALVNLQTNK